MTLRVEIPSLLYQHPRLIVLVDKSRIQSVTILGEWDFDRDIDDMIPLEQSTCALPDDAVDWKVVSMNPFFYRFIDLGY